MSSSLLQGTTIFAILITSTHAQTSSSSSSPTPTISFLLPPSSVPSSLPQNISNPLLSSLNFYPNTTQSNLFKNSRFSAICPFQTSAPLAGSGQTVKMPGGGAVMRSQAKTQEKFCMHLRPDIEWVIIPTEATPAAYLPTWASTLVTIGTLGIQWIFWIFSAIKSEPDESELGPMGIILFLWTCGQQGAWAHQMGIGFGKGVGDPNILYASWQDPTSWIAPTTYVLQFSSDNAGCRWLAYILFMWGYMNFIESLVAAALRFPPHYLGMGSYKPFLSGSFTILDIMPSLPPSARTTCSSLLRDPRYALFSDPLSQQIRDMEMVWTVLSLFVIPLAGVCAIVTGGDGTMRAWNGGVLLWSSVLNIVQLIWTGVLANRGTPFMYDERCGVVVIAMSPRAGYWDTEVHDFGYKLQTTRAVFGL